MEFAPWHTFRCPVAKNRCREAAPSTMDKNLEALAARFDIPFGLPN